MPGTKKRSLRHIPDALTLRFFKKEFITTPWRRLHQQTKKARRGRVVLFAMGKHRGRNCLLILRTGHVLFCCPMPGMPPWPICWLRGGLRLRGTYPATPAKGRYTISPFRVSPLFCPGKATTYVHRRQYPVLYSRMYRPSCQNTHAAGFRTPWPIPPA